MSGILKLTRSEMIGYMTLELVACIGFILYFMTHPAFGTTGTFMGFCLIIVATMLGFSIKSNLRKMRIEEAFTLRH